MSKLMITNVLAAASYCIIASPLLAQVSNPKQGAETKPVAAAAASCLTDLRTFSEDMQKQGYWSEASNYGFGYGYGYPMGVYGLGYGFGARVGAEFAAARPGYEVRTLMASARILARIGEEKQCQSVLGAARSRYVLYTTELHDSGYSTKNRPDRHQQLIATAQPVTGMNDSFRSDQLLESQIVSPNDEKLGSVHDLIMSPDTGKVAYVIISSGGLFGIGASYSAVPWGDFKASPNANLLVLDTTRAVIAASPQGGDKQFSKGGGFEAQKQKIDSYWSAHVKLATAQN
jgi:sporulation protein YlmC with PRC-barrel domain